MDEEDALPAFSDYDTSTSSSSEDEEKEEGEEEEEMQRTINGSADDNNMEIGDDDDEYPPAIEGPSTSVIDFCYPTVPIVRARDVVSELEKLHDSTGDHNEDSLYVRIFNMAGGRYFVPVREVAILIAERAWTQPVLRLCTPLKCRMKIHPILDVDYAKHAPRTTVEERMEVGRRFANILNKRIPGTSNWYYSTRTGTPSGVHLYHRDVCISYEEYAPLVKLVALLLNDGLWKVDAPSNLCLPYCGKESSPDFVYKNSLGNADCFVWCLESCRPLNGKSFENALDSLKREMIPSSVATSVKAGPTDDGDRGGGVAAASMTATSTGDDGNATTGAFSSAACLADHEREIGNYMVSMYMENAPTECNAENALYYTVIRNDDARQNVYSDAARRINASLGTPSAKDAVDACIAELFHRNMKQLIHVHGRELKASEAFFSLLCEALKNGQMLRVYLLMAYQYPIYPRDDHIQLYTDKGWRKEMPSFLDVITNAVSHVISEALAAESAARNNAKFKQPTLPKADLKRFIENFWNFPNRVEQNKKDPMYHHNRIVCSIDQYLFAKGATAFVKASVLHPFFTNNRVSYARDRLQAGLDMMPDLFLKTKEILDRCVEIKEGRISYYDLFGRDFMDNEVLGCVYFLVTYFDFNVPAIRKFLNEMHAILFGKTKRIIMMIGPEGDNGKTLLSLIIHNAFGDGSGVFNAQELIHNKNATSPDFVVNATKKITIFDEGGSVSLHANTLKRLTSGGLSSSRTLFQKNEVLQCLTNFILFGNERPKLAIDAAMKRRVTCFTLRSVFAQFRTSRDAYLSRKECPPLSEDMRFTKYHSFDLNAEALGFGFLLLIMYMPQPFDLSPEEVEQFVVEDILETFERDHVVAHEEQQVTIGRIKEAIGVYSENAGVDSSVLEVSFCRKYNRYRQMAGNCFVGIGLKNFSIDHSNKLVLYTPCM